MKQRLLIAVSLTLASVGCAADSPTELHLASAEFTPAALSIAPATVSSVNFLDDFEGTTIDPFWAVTAEKGTVELSSDQAHSGSQSVKVSSDPSTSGQRGLLLSHAFPQLLKGTVSVWLYDNATASLYAYLEAANTTLPGGSLGSRFIVLVRDFDGSKYHVSLVGGPYNDLGISGNVRTNIQRTVGWHEFRLNFNKDDVEFLIDGTLVLTHAGDFAFDLVHLNVSGPGQNATFYWDDFGVQALEPLVIEVAIDIKPRSFPNAINLNSGGTVPVAIFSTADFDATTVDLSTVTLAGARVKRRGNGIPMAAAEDADGDGRLDLVVHVETSALSLTKGDTEAVLTGLTFSGTRIRGVDSIRIVP